MLDSTLIVLTVLFTTASSMVSKSYEGRHPGNGALFFSSLRCFFAALFFIIVGGFRLHFVPELIPYLIAFGVSYGTATAAGYFAIRTGPLSLSSLITSYSLIVPTLYGLIFLNEGVGWFFYVGLSLVLISIFLMGKKGKSSLTEEGKVKIGPLWILSVALAFIGNGLCSTFQTAQQKAFLGEYKTELMVFSLLAVSLALAVISVFTERGTIKKTFKSCLPYSLLYGIFNGAVNLFVMMLTAGGRLSAAIIFPTISAGGIIATVSVAVLVYKERLSKWQITSLILGVLAVILMNL